MAKLNKIETLIIKSDLFSTLNFDEIRQLATLSRIVSMGSGSQIFKQGDSADVLYLVLDGKVELVVRVPGDDSHSLSQIGVGDFLGDSALLTETKRMLSAHAYSDCKLIAFDQAALRAFTLANRPSAMKVYLQFAQLLCKRLRFRDIGEQLLQTKAGTDSLVLEAWAEQKSTSGYRHMMAGAPLFKEFSDIERNDMLDLFTEYHLDKGQVIFDQESTGNSCYLVARGAIEITQSTRKGERRLMVLGPGKLFGEMSLLDGGVRGATGTVREKAIILELSDDLFHSLLQSGSKIALKLLNAINRNLMCTLQKANANLVALTLHSKPCINSAPERNSGTPANDDDDDAHHKKALVEKIRASVIGDDIIIKGPFGPCRMVYADYTATGRSLDFIEEFIQHEVMPYYANTHTESSGTGLQTTRLREDARNIILDSVGANDSDILLFVGSGATGAIDKLISVLGLKLPQELDDEYQIRDTIPDNHRPVVFVGPYEHHSNDVTWRMTYADTVMIMEDKEGRIDLEQLEQELIRYKDRKLKMGSFSAASNVTGIVTDDVAITTLLHQYGALSFWDYAAAAPYVKIEMNPEGVQPDSSLAAKDAIFISPHKFIGGPGTPGVLIAKKKLFRNKVPTVPGGGTVAYVSNDQQAFLEDPVHREEGGTPAIIESIRAGLVFQLKQSVGDQNIERLEHGFVQRAVKAWSENPNIWILGNSDLKRLSIVSLVIRHRKRFLHWNYVVALLNDLFGIQARGGCSCAGPYGHSLFGIESKLSESYQCQIKKGYEGIKPGWVRVNFNYFISEAVFNYIVSAVNLVATYGWKLLPLYNFNPATAMWTHKDGPPVPTLRLTDLAYRHGELKVRAAQTRASDDALSHFLERGRLLLENDDADCGGIQDPVLPEEAEALRWFVLPSEIVVEREQTTS